MATRKPDFVWIDEVAVFSGLDIDRLRVHLQKLHQRRLGVAAHSQQTGVIRLQSDVTAQIERES